MTIFLSFPTEVTCGDLYCPAREYADAERHTHTFYNVYEIPERSYYAGITEITVSEIFTSIRPFQLAPVNSMKGALQNV